MAVRTIDQILRELKSTYNPQVESIRTRQSLIPQQVQEEEKGLRAQEQDYYDNTIMGDARRRGIGFGGIPLGERARYGATQFLPALARNQAQGREQAMSLEDALLGVYERRNTLAQQMRQGDVDTDYKNRVLREETRRFNEQMAEQRRQAEASRRAASAGSAANNSWLSALSRTPTKPRTPAKADPMQQAFNNAYSFLKSDNTRTIISDYLATLGSANKGNAMDKRKLQVYKQYRPDLFAESAGGWRWVNGRIENVRSGQKY